MLFMMRGGILLILGHGVNRSRSTLTLCLRNLVDKIQTTDFALLLSNYIRRLLMMRGGTPIDFGSRGQGQLWHSV